MDATDGQLEGDEVIAHCVQFWNQPRHHPVRSCGLGWWFRLSGSGVKHIESQDVNFSLTKTYGLHDRKSEAWLILCPKT